MVLSFNSPFLECESLHVTGDAYLAGLMTTTSFLWFFTHATRTDTHKANFEGISGYRYETLSMIFAYPVMYFL